MMSTIIKKFKRFSRLPIFDRPRKMLSDYRTQIFLASVRKKAPMFLLIVIAAFSVVYACLHPLDKINLRYFLTDEYTITVINEKHSRNNSSSLNYYTDVSEIIIDGDWIKYKDDYYHMDGDKVYRYHEDSSGEWHSTEHTDTIFPTSFYALLNKNNYTRDKSNPFVWALKEEAYKNIHGIYNVRIKRVGGSIAIVGDHPTNGYDCVISLCFEKFGFTKISLPWED